MVNGLELFRDWFAGFEECYILIGGAACDLWMGEQGVEFRATKDLDIVLVFNGQRPDFVKRFWEFVERGAYQGFQAGEAPENFYRFQKPQTEGFPYKLEICTKHPLGVPADVEVIRFSGGEDVSSLSAILLDGEYFDLVSKNSQRIQGIPTATGSCLIPLKVKAWLNLSERKALGRPVDQMDINKHRNDAFRLLMVVAPGDKIELPPAVRDDLRRFINEFPTDSPEWGKIRASLQSNRLTLPESLEVVKAYREFHGLD